jgi:ElaB/YqjD/DUF883 family membrane-anchored ribosome-binding protein
MKNGALREPIQDLRNDLHAVARDTEALLEATAHIGGEKLQEARARTQETLHRALDHLYDRRMRRRVHRFARTTDAYVRDHSWTVIGALAAVALIVGAIASRRRW